MHAANIRHKKNHMEKNLNCCDEKVVVMKKIQALLPEGTRTINKYPVQKEIRRKNSYDSFTAWTCWVKNAGNQTFLAILSHSEIKLISEQEIRDNFSSRSIKLI